MIVPKWRRLLITWLLPLKTTWPVSALKPCSRPSPSAPVTQTIGSDVPSDVVTIGAPAPLNAAHQATVIGFLPSAATSNMVISEPEHLPPPPFLNATIADVGV